VRQHYATHVERHASRFIHDAIRLFTEALDFLSKDDIEWIIDNTAGEWMGCGPDGLM
jgi:hypothetical protein